MSQSSEMAALNVGPKEFEKEMNTCYLAAIRLQPFHRVSSEEDQDMKTQDTGPRYQRYTSKE